MSKAKVNAIMSPFQLFFLPASGRMIPVLRLERELSLRAPR